MHARFLFHAACVRAASPTLRTSDDIDNVEGHQPQGMIIDRRLVCPANDAAPLCWRRLSCLCHVRSDDDGGASGRGGEGPCLWLIIDLGACCTWVLEPRPRTRRLPLKFRSMAFQQDLRSRPVF